MSCFESVRGAIKNELVDLFRAFLWLAQSLAQPVGSNNRVASAKLQSASTVKDGSRRKMEHSTRSKKNNMQNETQNTCTAPVVRNAPKSCNLPGAHSRTTEVFKSCYLDRFVLLLLIVPLSGIVSGCQ